MIQFNFHASSMLNEPPPLYLRPKKVHENTNFLSVSHLEDNSTCFLLSLWCYCCATVPPFKRILLLLPVFESVKKPTHLIYLDRSSNLPKFKEEIYMQQYEKRIGKKGTIFCYPPCFDVHRHMNINIRLVPISTGHFKISLNVVAFLFLYSISD